MAYVALAIAYAAGVVGCLWWWSQRPAPSIAEQQASDAEEMAWLAARARAKRCRDIGDKRGEGEALKQVRAIQHARLGAEIIQMRAAK